MHYSERKITGWGNYPWVESKVYVPRTSDELKNILEQETSVINRGLGRSYGDQAVNKHAGVLSVQKQNHFLAFNESTGMLVCEAGVSLAEIIKVFAPRGWFPMINPGTKYVTIGGAIANDIHGKAHHVDGSFANCVESFTILLADGRIVSASRDENADLFWANFGGLGLLGSILTASIRLRKIETTYFKQKAIKVNNLDELLDAIDQYDQQYDYSVAWVDSLATGKRLGRGVLTTGNAAKLADLPAKLAKNPLYTTPNPKINLPFYVPGFALNTFTVSILNKILETVQSGAGDFAHYEKFFFPLDAINNWNRGYGKKGFIQYQFVVPEEGGRKSISDILKVIAKSGNSPFLNVLKKFGKGQSQSMLSFPMKGYTFAIDFPVRQSLRELTDTLDRMVVDRGGRIYLGKDAMLRDLNLFKKMYPRWEEWARIKQTYDPENKYSSNLSKRLNLESLGAKVAI